MGIHMELAARQDGLQVLHVVMFPKRHFDIPILGIDAIAKEDTLNFVIVDMSPVRRNRSLQDFYLCALKQLSHDSFRTINSPTAWGTEIFSPMCLNIKPSSNNETNNFIYYACYVTRMNLEIAHQMIPIKLDNIAKHKEISNCHHRYCFFQMKNRKTKIVLANSFGFERTEKYIREFMFEKPNISIYNERK